MDHRNTDVREWKAAGRNGYWAVEERKPEEEGNASYGHPVILNTKREATEVAQALNRAFRMGREYERSQQS